MRALVQRVTEASVCETDSGEELARIGPGLLVLLAVSDDDTEAQAAWIAGKISRLRIFSDEDDKMNDSVKDVAGSILVVSQFTLYGSVRRGNRPSFIRSGAPETAEPLYEKVVDYLRADHIPVQTGRFAADMQVRLTNDGPVTIWIDTEEERVRG
ncbi:MAG: D-aminoacyl-tRNA deacylase [Eubacteriales bacterium]|jgi:D-tyrosyl-tRNA(Tyr) deacylase|nr:D-aminoacyl-tRNA deacylase [Eubacteriales bacterium]